MLGFDGMYRSADPLSCPECHEPLVVAGGTFAVHACGRCGGVWLGPDAGVRVLQGTAEAADREAVAVAEAVGRTSAPPRRPREVPRACAQCQETMAALPIGDVMLDSCPAHGLWFDRDELAKVSAAAAKARDDHERKARGDYVPSVGEIVDEALSVAGGMVTLPLRALWDFMRGYCSVCKQLGFAHLAGCPEDMRWRDDRGRW